MTSLQDKLARLRADLAAATPGPLVVDEVVPNGVTDSRGGPIAVFADDSRDMALDEANARAHVGAVNAAPTLIDIAEAAAKYREAVDVRSNESNPASRLILFSVVMQAEAALFAALDRAEAEAGS